MRSSLGIHSILGSVSAVLAAAAMAACGGSTNPGTPSGGCTITLSGALTGTAPCKPVGGYIASSNQLSFAITNVATATSFSSLAFVIQLPGTSLQTGTFTSANSTKAQTAVAGSTSGQFWLQSFNFSGAANQGTFTFTTSSTGNELDSGGDKSWPNAHGSLTATLAPSGSASGSLNVSVTF